MNVEQKFSDQGLKVRNPDVYGGRPVRSGLPRIVLSSTDLPTVHQNTSQIGAANISMLLTLIEVHVQLSLLLSSLIQNYTCLQGGGGGVQ